MFKTMEYRMEILALILCVLPALVPSITISSNGNSPEIKLIGGMVVDAQKGFSPVSPKAVVSSTKSNYEKSRQLKSNVSHLAINERYRRLIPYMTFYYANDLVTPTPHNTKNIEVEKAEIIEARELHPPQQRQPKKIMYSPHRSIPRYQGNRLTQFNIASSNPTKIYYKDGVTLHQNQNKATPNLNPFLSEYVLVNNDYDSERYIPKPITTSSYPTSTINRKPYLSQYNKEESPDIRYYLSENEPALRYKLVPYEQTPPVKVIPQNENIYETKKPYIVSVLVPKEPVYIKPRPARPQYLYDNVNIQPSTVRKQPIIISESLYEKQRPQPVLVQPVIESGFKPIINHPAYTTESVVYSSTTPETPVPEYEHKKQQEIYDSGSVAPVNDYKPNYYQYVVEQPTFKPIQYTPSPTPTNSLVSLLNALQLNKSIPKPITKENVGSSIRTMLQVLNALKAVPQPNVVGVPVLSTPRPFVASNLAVAITDKPTEQVEVTPTSEISDDNNEDFHQEPYLAPVNIPSQHLEDYPTDGSTSQQFPLPITSDEEGGTPGRPGVDYPVLTTIPQTAFDCKTQRYKGFFADPETRCQVWHYCDLNGGQASFLCPNGTIFSQAGLTCDWWFNVRCASTTQLYVLNESLYKYILPHSPKFPEDYSGPLVDKYLTLKFKEMEEKFKKNKNKKTASDKMETDQTNDSDDESEKESDTSENTGHSERSNLGSVHQASVIVESPGTSGHVERLQE